MEEQTEGTVDWPFMLCSQNIYCLWPNQVGTGGSPTYVVLSTVDPTVATFGLCMHKWGIFVLEGEALQFH
jgi:hypothetical protein